MLEIRERIPFGKKKVSRENRETIVKEEKGKETEQGLKVEERKAWSSKICRINQVRGVYRRLMGIMG